MWSAQVAASRGVPQVSGHASRPRVPSSPATSHAGQLSLYFDFSHFLPRVPFLTFSQVFLPRGSWQTARSFGVAVFLHWPQAAHASAYSARSQRRAASASPTFPGLTPLQNLRVAALHGAPAARAAARGSTRANRAMRIFSPFLASTLRYALSKVGGLVCGLLCRSAERVGRTPDPRGRVDGARGSARRVSRPPGATIFL